MVKPTDWRVLTAAALVTLAFYALASRGVERLTDEKRGLNDDEKDWVVKLCADNVNASRDQQDSLLQRMKERMPDVKFSDVRRACWDGRDKARDNNKKRAEEGGAEAEKCNDGKGGELCPVASLAKNYPCKGKDDTQCCEYRPDGETNCARTAGANSKWRDLQKFKGNTMPNTPANKPKKYDGCTYFSQSEFKDNTGWGCTEQFPVNTGLNWDDDTSFNQHSCTTSDRCKRRVLKAVEEEKAGDTA